MTEPRSLVNLGVPERDLLAYAEVLELHRTRTGPFAKFALDRPAATKEPDAVQPLSVDPTPSEAGK